MDGARQVPGPDPRPSESRGSVEQGEVVLREDRDQIEAAVSGLLDGMVRLGFDESSAFAVRLAVEEAINNGFRHGNKSHPDKVVRLAWRATPEQVELEVVDQGEGFDPGAVPDPTAEENLEIPSGRGLMLMRAYMNHVEYLEPGNRVRMEYRRAAEEPG